MNTSPQAALWQAVHAAYEARNLPEARRLLHHSNPPSLCDYLHHCDDEEYVCWLLDNNLIPTNTQAPAWPDLQERQLQCNALPESERPRCIQHGEWEDDDTIREN